MGKRIPGKKHRGVKDPHAQKAARDEVLKNKINAPPKDVDYQEMPKSVERIMMLKQQVKEGKFNKPKKKRNKNNTINTANFFGKEKILPGMSKPDRNLPSLVQGPAESKRAFLYRVQKATDDFIREVNFEVKYNMKMKRDEKTGQVKFDKVELHPVDKMFQEKLDESKKPKHKKKKKTVEEEQTLSKTAKKRKRKEARRAQLQEEAEGEISIKKRKTDEEDDDFTSERFKDKVAFNEVVHRPPSITALPRKAQSKDEDLSIARRPGRKPGGLLLTKMLENPSSSHTEPWRRDLTLPRKQLSMSDRRNLDQAQTDAIQAYRQLKAQKSKGNFDLLAT